MTKQEAIQAAIKAETDDPGFFDSLRPVRLVHTGKWVVICRATPIWFTVARTPEDVANAAAFLVAATKEMNGTV